MAYSCHSAVIVQSNWVSLKVAAVCISIYMCIIFSLKFFFYCFHNNKVSNLARSVTIVWLWNVCELKVSRWQHKMQFFFICLPLLTPLPANASRDRQKQQEKRASMCVSVYVLYFVCFVIVCARLDHFCWFCSQSQHLRISGEVEGDYSIGDSCNCIIKVCVCVREMRLRRRLCSCDGCC